MKKSAQINRSIMSLFVIITLLGLQTYSFAKGVGLKEGTPVLLRLTQPITSAAAEKGQLVSFEVVEDVKIGNTVIIARGALAVGTVVEARSRRIFGRKGQMSLRLDYAHAVDGSRVSLRSDGGKILKIKQQVENSENSGVNLSGLIGVTAMASGMSAAPVALVPGLLLRKGKNVGVARGQLFNAYVEGPSLVKIRDQVRDNSVMSQRARVNLTTASSVTADTGMPSLPRRPARRAVRRRR